jgi:hypothetical protein
VREGDLLGQLLAEEMVSVWAASQPKARRPQDLQVRVAGGNDWRFKKSRAEVLDEIAAGRKSAAEQIKRWCDGR